MNITFSNRLKSHGVGDPRRRGLCHTIATHTARNTRPIPRKILAHSPRESRPPHKHQLFTDADADIFTRDKYAAFVLKIYQACTFREALQQCF